MTRFIQDRRSAGLSGWRSIAARARAPQLYHFKEIKFFSLKNFEVPKINFCVALENFLKRKI